MLVRTFSSLRCRNIHRSHSLNFSSNSWKFATKTHATNVATDELGLPLSPTWSVYELISSYPSPILSDANLTRLHDLAALIPPKEGSSEFKQLKRDIEDLVRLVEAVKMVPLEQHGENGPSDGRVWAAGRGILLGSTREKNSSDESPSGRQLLKHAQRTQDGFYLVDSARKKA